MSFTNEQLERYSRHIILKEIGVKGQKKLAAARRKTENEFAACEAEIANLEARNEEIDGLFEDPEIATNSVKLRELTEEKSANEAKLEELMQTWEDLYEKLNDSGNTVL